MTLLRMKSGLGEASYANNSTIQKLIASHSKEERQELAVDLYRRRAPDERMVIADLGCATGPNALAMVSDAVLAVVAECRALGVPPPEFQVFLNDLPTNDFNSLFRELPAERRFPFFVAAVPGSFYGRLFPARSLHYVVSSSSLHWLTQVPRELEDGSIRNRGQIHIGSSSPPAVAEAYKAEFQRDLFMFLSSRAAEMETGGLLILTFKARRCSDPAADPNAYIWSLMSSAFMEMAAQGLVEEEKVDNFNAPFYAPTLEELQQDIAAEGSFHLKRHSFIEADWYEVVDDGGAVTGIRDQSRMAAERTAQAHRAVMNSMFTAHFGAGVLDELFRRYAELLELHYRRNGAKLTNINIALQRK